MANGFWITRGLQIFFVAASHPQYHELRSEELRRRAKDAGTPWIPKTAWESEACARRWMK